MRRVMAGLSVVLLAGCSSVADSKDDAAAPPAAASVRASTAPSPSTNAQGARPTKSSGPSDVRTRTRLRTARIDGGCRSNGSPPQNGRIAFVANATQDPNSEQSNAPGDIYTVEPDGSSLHRLTRTFDASSPSWSPDGKQLAFIRVNWRGDYATTQWVMNADGSQQRLVGNVQTTHSVDWSPDGKKLALGTPGRPVVLSLETRETHHLPWSVRGYYPPDSPRWSADGKRLAGIATGKGPGPDDYTSNTAIFAVRSGDGGQPVHVPGARNLLGFDWSWQSCRLVFGSGLPTRGGECNGNLRVISLGRSSSSLLFAGRCRQSSPAWSPDGTMVAFESLGGIWVVDASGDHARRVLAPFRKSASLAGTLGALHNPDWQPCP